MTAKADVSKAAITGPKVGRRGFFGAAVGLTAAGLTAGGALPAFAKEKGDERTRARYQSSSPHVEQFYHVNRLVWPEVK